MLSGGSYQVKAQSFGYGLQKWSDTKEDFVGTLIWVATSSAQRDRWFTPTMPTLIGRHPEPDKETDHPSEAWDDLWQEGPSRSNVCQIQYATFSSIIASLGRNQGWDPGLAVNRADSPPNQAGFLHAQVAYLSKITTSDKCSKPPRIQSGLNRRSNSNIQVRDRQISSAVHSRIKNTYNFAEDEL